MWIHLVVRARQGCRPLHDDGACRWLWGRLVAVFPDTLAAVLMPDHLHDIVEVDCPTGAQRALARVIAGFGRRFGAGRFAPVPEPALVPDRKHLLRQLRYVHLNPCRAGLAADPCEWVWSTHRDVIGAVAQPWVDIRWLARQVGATPVGFASWFHGYVSGDPSVAVSGTRAPIPAASVPVARVPLAEIAYAAAAATRAPLQDLRRRTAARRLFLWVAREQGWDRASELAAICAISRRAVYKVWSGDPLPGLGAVRLCLGDRRLTRTFEKRRRAA